MNRYNFRFDDYFKDELYVDSHIPEKELIDFIYSNGVEKIIINYANGFNGNSIAPFCKLKQIKSISLILSNTDISCISKMAQLECLSIDHYEPVKLDVSVFPQLKSLSLTWNKEIVKLCKSIKLNRLYLMQFKGLIDELAPLVNLQELTLTQGNITSLEFINDYKKLNKLTLNYIPKLTDVSALVNVKDTLEELDIESCKNVNWQGELKHLKKLHALKLRGIKSENNNWLKDITLLKQLKKLILQKFTFEDLEWLKELPNLEHFSFWDSNVLSGDLSPALGIEFVHFTNKRHYNYKYDKLKMKAK